MDRPPEPTTTPTQPHDQSRAVEEAVARFEAALRLGQRPEVEDYLPDEAALRPLVLRELVCTDLEHQIKAGARRLAEGYFRRFPDLAADRAAAVELIEVEYRLCCRLDPDVTRATFLERFPELHDLLAPRLEASSDGLPAVPGYAMLGLLGRGGMGVVYKARHLALDRTVALKMIRGDAHAGAEEVARFRSEAQAAARLVHPNVVQIYEVGEANGLPYCCLEYVPGGSLAAKLRGEPQSPRTAAAWVETLARGVEAAHRAGVIHRDLKPANVLLTEDGTLKVADFGLAKRLDADDGRTVANAIMGTPSYMAPEQAAGRSRDVGPAADVYALGAILYELLTGRPPFRGQTPTETLDLVRTQEPVPPRSLVPKCPRDLETICLKCLRKEARSRYCTALELAEDLRRFLDGEAIRARPVGVTERAVRWLRKRPAAALAGLLALLTLLGAWGGYYLWGLRQRALAESVRLQNEADAKEKAELDARTEKVTHFAGYVWRRGEPFGVAPVGPDAVSRRHRTYRFVRVGDVLERMEVINGLGASFRGDALQGVPAWEQPFASGRVGAAYRPQRSKDGRLQAIEGRDRNGFVRVRLRDPLAETSELTELGDPLDDNGGLPSTVRVRFTWGDGGLLREAHYVSAQGKPTRNAVGAYGYRWDYDERGIPIRRTWLGPKGEPWDSRDGTCRTDFTLDERGDVIAGGHFDAADKPVRNALGFARWTILRDDHGNERERAFFDEGGKPVRAEGIHKRVLTYDARGNVVREWFLDERDKPALRRGAAGLERGHDEFGNVLVETFLDAQGRPVRTEEGFARRRARYDTQGNAIETRYFDADDRPATGPHGAHRVAVRHDLAGGVSRWSLFNAEGSPAVDTRGVHAWVSQRDAAGRETERTYLGRDARPHLLPEGYAVLRRVVDSASNLVGEQYFGTEREPVRHRDGYHLWAGGPFSLAGLQGGARRYYGPNDKEVLNSDGYHSRLEQQNDHGDVIGAMFGGLSGQPVVHREGYVTFEADYDERGNQTEVVWRGLNGEPVITQLGGARITRTFDRFGRVREEILWTLDRGGNFIRTVPTVDAGRIVELRYTTEKGEPALHLDGHHAQKFSHDVKGRPVEITYFGLRGEPVANRGRVHRWSKRYDKDDRLIEESFFDTQGNPATHFNGCHRHTLTYDKTTGLCTEERFFDVAERLVVIPPGCCRITRARTVQGTTEELLWELDAAGNFGRFLRSRAPGSQQQELFFVDGQGRPTLHPEGYARRVEKLDLHTRVVEASYFGLNGEKVLTADGFHSWKAKHSAVKVGLETERRFFDLAGRPAETRDGTARIVRGKGEHFNNGFQIWEERLNLAGRRVGFAAFDGNHRPVLTEDAGVHRWIHVLHGQERETQICLGTNNEPLVNRQGFHKQITVVDTNRRGKEQFFLGLNDEPVEHVEGYHRWRREYDSKGNEIELAFYSKADKLTRNKTLGYARITTNYNASSRRRVSQTTYNDGNRKIEYVYLGPDGKPALNADGYARIKYTQDERGFPLDSTPLDLDGKPVPGLRVSVNVVPAGSLAEKAGVQKGDVLLTLDEQEITNAYQFFAAQKRQSRAGATGKLKLLRGQDAITVELPPGDLGPGFFLGLPHRPATPKD